MQKMQKTWLRSLGQEDPLEEGMTAHPSVIAWKPPMDRTAWWATVHAISESDTTERLSTPQSVCVIRKHLIYPSSVTSFG